MLIKCYHFCSEEFYNSLMEKGVIEANDTITYKGGKEPIPEDLVKEYVFKTRKLNGGKGMFFCWSKPNYKGDLKHKEDGKYYLLELVLDDSKCIKTHYENWCSLGMDLYENDNDLERTDIYCRDIGFVDGLESDYQSIFAISEGDEIQILLPMIDKKWIRGYIRTDIKYV